MGFIDAITTVPGLRCLDDCDEWCVGLPLQRIRVLDIVEIEPLQRAVNDQFRRHRAYACSFACIFAGLYLSTMLFANPVLFSMTVVDATLMTSFILWLVSSPESWIRRNRALQADISAGLVHCFHHPSCAGPLEVLPRAEIVYKSNEFSPRKWRRAPIASTAKTPAIASIATEWLQPVDGPSGHFFAGKRALSTTEIAEINRCADFAWNTPKRNAISCVLWVLILTSLSRSGYSDLFYAGLLLCGFPLMRIVPELKRAMDLRRDVEGGLVIINRRASLHEGAFVPLGQPAEYLPQAKLKWTDGCQPAEWRKFA